MKAPGSSEPKFFTTKTSMEIIAIPASDDSSFAANQAVIDAFVLAQSKCQRLSN